MVFKKKIKRFCENCGEEMDPNPKIQYCALCGHPLGTPAPQKQEPILQDPKPITQPELVKQPEPEITRFHHVPDETEPIRQPEPVRKEPKVSLQACKECGCVYAVPIKDEGN